VECGSPMLMLAGSTQLAGTEEAAVLKACEVSPILAITWGGNVAADEL